jgi:hypothetical protein
VLPSVYVTVNLWEAWLPFTAVARSLSVEYLPAGRATVAPLTAPGVLGAPKLNDAP